MRSLILYMLSHHMTTYFIIFHQSIPLKQGVKTDQYIPGFVEFTDKKNKLLHSLTSIKLNALLQKVIF